MRFPFFLLLILATSALATEAATNSELTPSSVFSDHMILQRDMEVPVWGKATPGEKVTATFAGKSASAVTGADGAWRLKIGPFAVNDKPGTMKLSSEHGASLEIKDVLVGEVWVGAGQSNMQIWITSFRNSSTSRWG